MCTAFSYCRFQKQRLRGFGSYAPKSSGSSGSGPWTLRSKRLQWLTNIRAGFKIAAFPVFLRFRNSTTIAVTPAQAGVQLPSCFSRRKRDASRSLSRAPTRGWHDGVKGGAGTINNTSRALPQFSCHLRILIGRKATAETSPPFFSCWVLS